MSTSGGQGVEATTSRGLRRFARFRSDCGGNVAVMLALLAVPLIGIVGMAVDYGRLMVALSRAQSAADAAALNAAVAARDRLRGTAATDADIQATLADAKKSADRIFSVNYANTDADVTQTISLTKTGSSIEAKIDFSVSIGWTLSGVLSSDKLVAAGKAVATSALPLYLDIHMLLDISQSMGLGATLDDMKKLYAVTPDKCIFACHVSLHAGSPSNLSIAIANNVKLRVDVLREATKKMILQASQGSGGQPTYRFSLNTFGTALTVMKSLTYDYDSLIASVNTLTLGPNDTSGYGDSNFAGAMTSLKSKIATSGDGSSQAKAKTYLYIITDGVQDVYGASCLWGHCMATVDTTKCKDLKDRGTTIGVIYTTYLPVPVDPNNPTGAMRSEWTGLVQPLESQIAPKLKECASGTDYYFEASDGPAIDAALQKLFFQTTQAAMLGQ